MHGYLQNLCLMTLHLLVGNYDRLMEVLVHYGVLPPFREPAEGWGEGALYPNPLCTCVEGTRMKCIKDKDRVLGWRYRCPNKYLAGVNCTRTMEPTHNTYVFATHTKIQVQIAVAAMEIMRVPIMTAMENINCWKRLPFPNDATSISTSTMVDYYNFVRDVGRVIMSNKPDQWLGQEGATIEVDETFVTRRKYHMGTMTNSMTTIIFGMYCRETKQVLFFRVPNKGKRALWPLIKKWVHPGIARICSDGAATYQGVAGVHAEMFPDAIHDVVIHSEGVFADPEDPTNHINSIENENKLIKREMRNRRTDKIMDQYIAWHCYRRCYLSRLDNNGMRLRRFLKDTRKVYPGAGQVGITGVNTFQMLPLPEEYGIEHLMPVVHAPGSDFSGSTIIMGSNGEWDDQVSDDDGSFEEWEFVEEPEDTDSDL